MDTVAWARFRAIRLLLCSCSIVAALACATPPEPPPATAIGTYVSEDNSNESLQLKADGTFLLHERGERMTGEYRIQDQQIALTANGNTSIGRIDGETLVDMDGERWTKR
jgi:hypothetical protein